MTANDSIRDATFSLCKGMRNHQARSELHDLIESLTVVPADGKHAQTDRSTFGYFAKQEGIQFLGYVLLDDNREMFDKSSYPFPLPPLETHERELLVSAHETVRDLNRRCLQPLIDANPVSSIAADPYNRFEYHSAASSALLELFQANAVDRLVETFHQHPGIEIALHSQHSIAKLAGEKYRDVVVLLNRSLMEQGPLVAPPELNNLIIAVGKDHRERVLYRHFLAIAAIRDSLQNINQLVFQATARDQLLSLDESNVFDLDELTSNIVSNGTKVRFQPNQDGFMWDAMDIVVLDAGLPQDRFGKFWRVESVHAHMDPRLGTEIEFLLREIDQDLCSIGKPLGHI